MGIMKTLLLYFKNHWGYLLLLHSIFVIPLGLFFQFSKYPLPKIQYFDLAFLILYQYAFYNEKNYRKKNEPMVISKLQRELKRTPSSEEINDRLSFNVVSRGFTLLTAIVGILFIMVFYKKF